MITHEREFFYKYVTPEAGKAILQTQSIRWGCPLTFNDPFDTQLKLRFDFSMDELVEEFINIATKLIYSDEAPLIVHNGTLGIGKLIPMLRTIRHKIPIERFREESKEALFEGASDAMHSLKESNNDWHEYVTNSRVLCVTEENDNLLMWAHYASDHKGLVIQLKCLPEHDTALCAAEPIKYVTKMPSIAKKDEFIKDSLGLIKLDQKHLFKDLIFTKSDHWIYEKEWRCFSISHEGRSDPTGAFDTDRLLTEEVSAVYLGCKISETDKAEILSILQAPHYQHVKIFESKPDRESFRLIFDQIR